VPHRGDIQPSPAQGPQGQPRRDRQGRQAHKDKAGHMHSAEGSIDIPYKQERHREMPPPSVVA